MDAQNESKPKEKKKKRVKPSQTQTKTGEEEDSFRGEVHNSKEGRRKDRAVKKERKTGKRELKVLGTGGHTGEDGPPSQVDSGFAEVGHDDVTEPPPETVFDQDEQITQDNDDSKRKSRHKGKKEAVGAANVSESNIQQSEEFSREEVLAVTIHQADKLRPTVHIAHPVVQIHIIDSQTGTYVKKLHSSRHVTSYFETKNSSVDYILPVLSQPFDIKKHKSLSPAWEETLVFNEDFSYFVLNQDIILFFEILDFLGMGVTEHKWMGQKTYKGWHHIAWAFLKLQTSSGNSNTGRRVRLQLFEFPSRNSAGTKAPGIINIFHVYSHCQRIPYPSTLHVTVRSIPMSHLESQAQIRDNLLRSILPTEQERGRQTFEQLDSETRARLKGGVSSQSINQQKKTIWTRLPSQACRIPNKKLYSLQSGKKGCFILKFSHDGCSLAAGCGDEHSFPIIIYEIPSGLCKAQFAGHYNIVYDMSWSSDDRHLASASSDGTVRVWNVLPNQQDVYQILPHPCFIYSAQVHPACSDIVVTGGYDQVVRVWSTELPGKHGQLLREMDGHRGLVNSIAFDSQGIKMFSADSTGTIIMWTTNVNRQQTTDVDQWNILKEISSPDLKGVPINHVEVHPSGRRLLIHCRDNAVRLFDLRIFNITQQFVGATNYREHLHSTVTPCGTFVLSGSEDGRAYVWNCDSGDQVAVYSDLGFGHPVSDVAFHPHDHIVAFCSFGDNQPVLIYKYEAEGPVEASKNKEVTQTEPLTSKHVGSSTVSTSKPSSTASPSGLHQKTSLADVASQKILVDRVVQRLSSALKTSRPPRDSFLSTGKPSNSATSTELDRSMKVADLLGSRSRGHEEPTLAAAYVASMRDTWRPSFASGTSIYTHILTYGRHTTAPCSVQNII
jgi:jouberin